MGFLRVMETTEILLQPLFSALQARKHPSSCGFRQLLVAEVVPTLLATFMASRQDSTLMKETLVSKSFYGPNNPANI